MSQRKNRAAPAAVAALIIAAGSGFALALAYDPAEALASVARMLLADPAARFARNLHLWSALAFLMLAILAVRDQRRRSESEGVAAGAGPREPKGAGPHVAGGPGQHRPIRAGLRAILGAVALALLVASGFALRGEPESLRSLEAASEALATIPGIGPLLATVLVGNGEGLRVVLIHHALTFTLLAGWWLIGRRRPGWPRWPAIAAILLPAVLLSLWLGPSLDDGLPGEARHRGLCRR